MSSPDAATRKRARLPSVQDGVDLPSSLPPQLSPRSHDSRTSSPAAGESGPSSISFRTDLFGSAHGPQAKAAAATSAPQAPKLSTNPTSSSRRGTPSSSFRNVSACNRCRVRKNRCDQRLPACEACEKAGAKCVGYDPFLGKEIPRSYVYFLECRTSYLEKLLQDHGIEYSPADDFTSLAGPVVDHGKDDDAHTQPDSPVNTVTPAPASQRETSSTPGHGDEREDKVDRLVSDIGMISVQGLSDPRYLGSTSGISFARVVFNAVKHSVSRASSERGSRRSSKSGLQMETPATMRDSVFGLHTKPNVKAAPFPDRELGLKLVNLYFENANPQIPTLHRGEFMTLFDRVYTPNHRKTTRESYLLNIVFAIGAGVILDSSDKSEDSKQHENAGSSNRSSSKKARLAGVQYQPEEYHAAAIVHLESFLGSSAAGDRPDGYGGGLEELQAVLLLAGFALLRPVAPGLWYIVGVAVRLAVDLGLHYEDGADIKASQTDPSRGDVKLAVPSGGPVVDQAEIGRRQWVRDLRRRLWWCVYSFDRLVGTVVGRPFSISDQVVTTSFPSPKNDDLITTNGILESKSSDRPSYKLVAYHYFRLRLLQSEIVQVLQYQSAQKAHEAKRGRYEADIFLHDDLPSPFLHRFITFGEWRRDMDRRLWLWKQSAPTREQAGVAFNPQFLELNYWQAVILLYRQSVTTPTALAQEENTVKDGMSSPHGMDMVPEEDEDEDFVYLKLAEAGQKVLKIYRHLHRMHLVNYTYLATHHLFMAGISFLYAIWYSTTVRTHLTLDEVDATILATLSVLNDLTTVCPPAQSCKDAFDRMSRIVLHMAQSTTGFGRRPDRPTTTAAPFSSRGAQFSPPSMAQPTSPPRYRIDMDLGELFNDDQLSPTPSQPPFFTQAPPSVYDGADLPFLDNFSFSIDGARDGSSSGAGGNGVGDASMGADPMGADDLSNLQSWGIGGGTHDWSEGQGADMFGGFFFGAGS